jgi:hypothetical protein
VNELFEQLRDIYCGRHTYYTDEEWIANMDAIMAEICNLPESAMDFDPQAYRADARQCASVVGSIAWQREHERHRL